MVKDKKRLKKLGNNMKSIRMEKGMTQDQVAWKTGYISSQMLSRFERAVSTITALQLLDLSIALKTPLEAFYEGV